MVFVQILAKGQHVSNEQAILVLNAGSSSIKFAVFVFDEKEEALDALCHGEIDGIGHQARLTVRCVRDDASLIDESAVAQTHDDALKILLDWTERHTAGLHFVAAGHRVVHGGTFFLKPVIVNAEVDARLEQLIPLAPLHQPHNLAAIRALKQLQPEWVQVACFDTAFHHTMPPVAQSFALPRALTEEGLRCYGFHGLSYEYIASALPDFLGTGAEGRVIVAHLGHGASMCAMKGRNSIATTMTFTPLDGLPMGTRCGAIDPGVVLYLMREKGMDVDAVSDLLHHQSGLLGLSGVSGDMRELLVSDRPEAGQAIDFFVYRAGRELGSLAAALGGLDALVFTAGIGEHAPEIRERICREAAWLGVCLDEGANAAGGPRINRSDSSVSVWVIPTNEELIVARHTLALMDK